MASITRRQITSGGDPLAEAKANRPKRTAKNTPRKLQNLAPHSVTFEALDGVTNLAIKIAFLPEGIDHKHDELAEKAILALGKREIQFRNGFYVTEQADVIAWLRYRIKHKLSTSFREYTPPPKVVHVGPDAVYTTESGERLMTYDQFLSLQQQIESYGLPDPTPLAPENAAPQADAAPAVSEEAPQPEPAKTGSKKRGSNGTADN